MDQFVEQLRQVSPLSDEIVGQLLEEMKEVSFAKGELSIREGERDPFVWFVKTGLVRAFVEREGKDISLWFASDSEVINFVYRDISAYNVQMVENTTLLRIPKTKLDYLCRSSLELANWGLKIQDYYLREYENYFINDSWMEAREQYESLLKTSGLDLETTLETYRLLFTDNPTVIEPYPCFCKKIGKSHYLS